MRSPVRKQLAVMFTDIAGFTARMERDETDALAILVMQREFLQAQLEHYSGSMVKEMGDGTLSIFPASPMAVNCARSFQNDLKSTDFLVRIGIHWGGVLQDENDVFGDTVNVASRLEAISAPGGICISRELLSNYGSGRKPLVEALGLRKLKGLGRLVDVFAVVGSGKNLLPVRDKIEADSIPKLIKATKVPSIAVTLLENLGSESDAFYAYGITADLVTDLSRAGRISVVPLSSVMKASDRIEASENIAEKLNVRFLVKGALWKVENQFRLSIELHDVRKGQLVWTDNWEDDWFELPSIKGKLADSLLKALGLEPGSFPGITGIETTKTSAYELYLQGKHLYTKKHSKEDIEKARELYGKALDMDPGLIPARISMGVTYREEGDFERARGIFEEAYSTASEKSDKAGQLNALNAIGVTQWMTSDFRRAKHSFQNALRMATSIDDRIGAINALNNLGLMEISMGRYREALPLLEKALNAARELTATGKQACALSNIGLVSAYLGNNDAALDSYSMALDLLTPLEDLAGQADILRLMAIIHSRAGSYDKAMDLNLKSLNLVRDLEDKPRQCKILNNMGNIRNNVGMFDKAMSLYHEAIEMTRGIDDPLMEGILLTNIGSIHHECGRHEAALALFEEALEICRCIEDPEGEIDVLLLLGKSALKRSRPNEAVEHLRGALEIIDRTDAETFKANAMSLLAMAILEDDPDKTQCKEAVDLAETAEKVIPEHLQGRSGILWQLAVAYDKLSELSPAENARLNFTSRYRELVEQAHDALMMSADLIADEPSRKSFLTMLGSNRELIKAWECLDKQN